MMRGNGGMAGRPRWLLLVAGLAALALAGALIMAALQPTVADRFGYALARPNGLPGQFTYQYKTYHAPDFCAGGASCDPARASRETEASLQAKGLWPLKQVAMLPTLFGATHPILEPVNDPSMAGAGTPNASDVTPFLLFIPDPASPGAYVMYTRDGGP
jgi:hypothetical protein